MPIPFLDSIYKALKEVQEVQVESNELKKIPESKQSKNVNPNEGVSTKGESSKLGQSVPEWTGNLNKDNLYLKTPLPKEYGYDTLGKKETVITAKKPKDSVLPDWFMDIAQSDIVRKPLGRIVTNLFDKEYDLSKIDEFINDPIEAVSSVIKDERFNVGKSSEEVFNGVPLGEVNADALFRDMFGLEHRAPNDLIKQKDGTYALADDSDHPDVISVIDDLINSSSTNKVRQGENWLLGNYQIKDVGDSYEVYDRWDIDINPNETLNKDDIGREPNQNVIGARHLMSAFTTPSTVKFKVPKSILPKWKEYLDMYANE